MSEKTVDEYELPTSPGYASLWMSAGASVVGVAAVGGTSAKLWAADNGKKNIIERKFRLALSGVGVEADADYVGTLVLHHGALILHVFELSRKSEWYP